MRYVIAGLAVAYDDVVDVNLKVWGDEWEQPLGRLTATMTGPGEVVRAWGHPVWVRGDVTLAGNQARLRAVDVSAGQFVELRALYPRAAFASTGGMRVAEGDGLAAIAAEEQADADDYERDHERIQDAISHPWGTALLLLALATLPAFAVGGLVFWFFGREVNSGYDREYEQEPPTETEPALVPVLLAQGGGAGSFEFTATLFDLIRRGVYRSTATTTERSTWGGLRKEFVNDLELSKGDESQPLTAWERDVADVVDAVLDGGSERLSRFREQIEEERQSMSKRFTAFKASVTAEVRKRRWFASMGARPARRRCARLRAGRRGLGLPRDRRLALGLPPLERRRPACPGRVRVPQRGHADRRAHPAEALAPPLARGRDRGGALGGLPPLPDGLSAARRGTARLAGAVGALPRLRDRLRHRRARAAGRAPAHARAARAGQLDLLDLAGR